jgi:hypothetical protein
LNITDIISSGILEQFVLGKTTAAENSQVLAWKNAHPEVAKELEEIELNLELLDIANAKQVGTNTKANIFSKLGLSESDIVNNNQQEEKVINNTVSINPSLKNEKLIVTNWWKYAAAASVLLLLGTAYFGYQKNKALNEELAKAKTEVSIQKEEIAALNKNLAIPLNNFSQSVALKGTAGSPQSSAKIFWVRNTGEVFIEPGGLPEAPKGFQYQLWAIVDGKPVDGGMISGNQNGKKYNFQKMKTFGKAQAFAITLEKEGGSATPTMEKMYVMGTI